MIIVGNRNKKTNGSSTSKIINLTQANLTPKVLSKKTVTDQFGNSDTLLTLKFYCQVDAVKVQNLKNYEKIEFKLSKNNLNYYANIANSTSAKLTGQKQVMAGALNNKNPTVTQGRSASNPLGNNSKTSAPKVSGSRVTLSNSVSSFVSTSNKKKNPLTVRQLKNSLGKANLFRQNKNANIYKNTTSIGYIDLSKIKSFKTTEKVVEVTENTDRRQAALAIARERSDNRAGTRVLNRRSSNKVENSVELTKVFQRFYLSSLEENKDPIVMFQEPFKKNSFSQIRKGLVEKPGMKYNKKIDLFLEMHRNIANQIGSLSSTAYRVTEKTVSKDFVMLGLTVSINLSTLRSFGNQFYTLMFGKSLNGQKIESSEYRVSLSDIEMQLDISASEYSVNTSRTGPGVSVLKATNKTNKGKVNLFVEAKTIKRQMPNNFSYFSAVNNFDVQPKSEFLMRDGRLRGNGRNPIYFNASDTIFYRTLLGFRDKKYFNCKASVDANPRGFQENLPFCTVIAKNPGPNQSDGIYINVDNISNNVVAIRPKKYSYKGNARGKLISLQEEDGRDLRFTYVDKLGTKASFVDLNVKEKRYYMYVVECLMNNGERKIAPTNFVVRYEKRTGTVDINDIRIEAQDPVVDASDSLSFNSTENLNQRTVNIQFKINKVQREVDKILENMFGNLFDLFEDKLKTIRDIQSLVYSVEIVRINNFTGAAETIGKVTPDENGLCEFTDMSAPFFESCTYQFLPRVMLASEAIEEVNSQIEILSKRLKRSPVNYARASRRAKSYRKKNRIQSIQRGKFNRRNAFTKSVIESESTVVDRQNFDVFLDSTTGDVFEQTLKSTNPHQVPGDVFKVTNPSIKRVINELENLDASADKNVLNDDYYDITFQVGGDVFIDFYAIYVKEGKNIYLDGAMHSSDSLSSKKYSYLVKHRGSKGVIEYYAVPFYKNGTVGSPKIITAQAL